MEHRIGRKKYGLMDQKRRSYILPTTTSDHNTHNRINYDTNSFNARKKAALNQNYSTKVARDETKEHQSLHEKIVCPPIRKKSPRQHFVRKLQEEPEDENAFQNLRKGKLRLEILRRQILQQIHDRSQLRPNLDHSAQYSQKSNLFHNLKYNSHRTPLKLDSTEKTDQCFSQFNATPQLGYSRLNHSPIIRNEKQYTPSRHQISKPSHSVRPKNKLIKNRKVHFPQVSKILEEPRGSRNKVLQNTENNYNATVPSENLTLAGSKVDCGEPHFTVDPPRKLQIEINLQEIIRANPTHLSHRELLKLARRKCPQNRKSKDPIMNPSLTTNISSIDVGQLQLSSNLSDSEDKDTVVEHDCENDYSLICSSLNNFLT